MASGAEGKKVVGRLTIRVSPDMDGFREEVERKANATAKETKPKVKVDADTDEAKRKIHVIEDEKYGAVVDLDADTRGAEAHIKEATRDRHMTVHVHEDRSALDRMRNNFRSMGRELEKSFEGVGSLGKNIKFPDLVPNIGGLGGFGSIAIIVGALSLVAPALALLSQALVGLPALISAVALPLGTLALGFGGIRKALDAAGFLDIITGKAKKDGTKGKGKVEPGQVIDDLKTKISDVFSTGLTPVFTQIANVLPQLTRGLPFVAQGLVKMAEGLGNIVASPAFLDGFDRFTNSVGTMLTNLAPAIQLFTSGMMNLITNVGDHLPGLGNKMTEWAGQFQHWVETISKPQVWWGKEIPNSSTLDKAVSNIGPELDTLFSSIGNLVNKGLELATKPDMAKGIQDTFTGIEHLIDQLTRLGPVFESLAAILDAIPSVTRYDPKAPYGMKPGPAGGPPIPKTHDDAMKETPGFWSDPGGWFDAQGSKAKASLGDAIKDLPKTLWEDIKKIPESFNNLIGLGFLNGPGKNGSTLFDWSKIFGGAGPTGTASADTAPFNPGTRVGTAPIPVTPVGPAGGSPALNNLLLPPTPPAVPGAAIAAAGAQVVPPPKIEAPKAPEGSDKIWEPLIAATQKAGADINTEVSSWSGKIKGALDSAASGAAASGQAIGAQLASGIRAGQGAAVAAAHDLAQAVKDALPHSPAKTGPFSGHGWTQVKTSGGAIASQFADGLDGGYDGIVAASKRLMDAVHQSMDANGSLSPQITAAMQRESAAIGIELDRLKAQRDALPKGDKSGRASIKEQMDQLRALKDEFGANGKMSKYNSKYGGAGGQDGPFTAQGIGQMFTQEIASGLNAMLGFGQANVNQLEQDLGMSGNGVVEQLGNYGIQFLSSGLNSLVGGFFGQGGKGGGGNTYNFHSRDDDGMMQNYQRTRNFEAMAYSQRSN